MQVLYISGEYHGLDDCKITSLSDEIEGYFLLQYSHSTDTTLAFAPVRA